MEQIKSMKKIALILTGGTIGSVVEEHAIRVGENSVYQLVEAYEKTYGEKDSFEVFSPFQALSEDFTEAEWQKLYDFLYTFPFSDYEGVIVAHGTDTLAYTAALVGMLFPCVKVPILFIASNYPIGTPKSNGLTNLRGAVCFLRQHIALGTFVIYENNREQVEVHLSDRLIPADNAIDQYGSFGGECFGLLLPKGEEKEEFYFVQSEAPHNVAYLEKKLQELLVEQRPLLQNPVSFKRDVLFLMPYPGQNYGSIVPDENVAAVYHYLYHAGTACTTPGNYSFLQFAKKMQQQGLPVYVASLKSGVKDSYVTQQEMLKAGVHPLYDSSPVAGYIRLVIAYNQQEMSPEEYLTRVQSLSL